MIEEFILNNKELQNKISTPLNDDTSALTNFFIDGTYRYALNILLELGKSYTEDVYGTSYKINKKVLLIQDRLYKLVRIKKKTLKYLIDYCKFNHLNIYAITTNMSFLKYNYYLLDYDLLKNILNKFGVNLPDYMERISLVEDSFEAEISKEDLEKLIKRVNIKYNEKEMLLDKYTDELIESYKTLDGKRNENIRLKKEEKRNEIINNTKAYVIRIYETLTKKYLNESDDILIYEYFYEKIKSGDTSLLGLEKERNLGTIAFTDIIVDIDLIRNILRSDGFTCQNDDVLFTFSEKIIVSIQRKAFEDIIKNVNGSSRKLMRE